MRKVIFSLLLATGAAIGLAGSTAAQAYDSGRIYIDLGDVTFSYGRPHWRYNHEPLYVVYERGYPRYYRIVDSGYYGPGYGYPPPPAYGYHPGRDWRHDGRYDGRNRWDRGWDRGRGDWRDGRRYPRHRDRYWN